VKQVWYDWHSPAEGGLSQSRSLKRQLTRRSKLNGIQDSEDNERLSIAVPSSSFKPMGLTCVADNCKGRSVQNRCHTDPGGAVNFDRQPTCEQKANGPFAKGYTFMSDGQNETDFSSIDPNLIPNTVPDIGVRPSSSMMPPRSCQPS
jgi:hypothetical protein